VNSPVYVTLCTVKTHVVVLVYFVFMMHDYLCSVNLGLLYFFAVISPVFNFFSTNHKISREEHLRNDLFCVEWDVEP